MSGVKITPEELKLFSAYVKSTSGIYLDDSKAYLLETRLSRLLAETSSDTFSDFYRKITADGSGKLREKLIDAITTNETLFFRDTSPFDLLQHKIFPDLIDRRYQGTVKSPVTFRIWSAACSTGQEVYSISIVLKELLGNLASHNITILGTDISDAAVKRASYGHYNWIEIERGLDVGKKAKYFTQAGKEWKIDDEIRSVATFKKLNLFENFSSLGRFDIIFCRNVAIYFTEPDKKSLFNRIGEVLKPDGYLIIGSAESITGICPQYESKRYLRSVFYQLK